MSTDYARMMSSRANLCCSLLSKRRAVSLYHGTPNRRSSQHRSLSIVLGSWCHQREFYTCYTSRIRSVFGRVPLGTLSTYASAIESQTSGFNGSKRTTETQRQRLRTSDRNSVPLSTHLQRSRMSNHAELGRKLRKSPDIPFYILWLLSCTVVARRLHCA